MMKFYYICKKPICGRPFCGASFEDRIVERVKDLTVLIPRAEIYSFTLSDSCNSPLMHLFSFPTLVHIPFEFEEQKPILTNQSGKLLLSSIHSIH